MLKLIVNMQTAKFSLGRKMKAFGHDTSGATALEYGLIAAGIGVAVMTAAWTLGDEIQTMFGDITTALQGRQGPNTN